MKRINVFITIMKTFTSVVDVSIFHNIVFIIITALSSYQ